MDRPRAAGERRLRAKSSILAALLLSSLAAASARADDADVMRLGPVTGYGSEAEATAHCGGDGVVWADHDTGFLYPRFMEQFGHTPGGAFTCYKQAKAANYWGFGAIDTMGIKGKSFPFTRCPDCS